LVGAHVPHIGEVGIGFVNATGVEEDESDAVDVGGFVGFVEPGDFGALVGIGRFVEFDVLIFGYESDIVLLVFSPG